jgi:type II restriction enzyme
MKANKYINSAADLITSRAETRLGFINMALEKNYLAGPYIEEAKALKALTKGLKDPNNLLEEQALRPGLITASGLSVKALQYLTDEDKTKAIQGLIDKYLIPAGEDFGDELVYRYLLTKGDALGGQARNLAGSLGEIKFMRCMLSLLRLLSISYHWCDSDSKKWLQNKEDEAGIDRRVKGLAWEINNKPRLLLTNLGVPHISKNVDLVILNGTLTELGVKGKKLIKDSSRYIALGELKGGIDPAGADEHWKTANTALGRIRNSFENNRILTFFIGAAIENAMAEEIFLQLTTEHLSNAANLTCDDQLTDLCNWLLNT